MSDLPLRLTLTTAPKVEPVSDAEAMAHARIDSGTDKAVISGMVSAARRMCENYTRRAFITQSWTMYLDAWPCDGVLELPRAPLVSVTHIKTYDESDVATTFGASNYYVDTATKPGRVVLRSAATWPTVERVANGVEILFVAGYGANPENVPEDVRIGILETFAHLYEHRGDANVELPATAQTLLSSHKDWLV